ncbi:MAG TPA: cold shock domain-containing protein [Bacteroidia bacterium]|nr:cold shock domain-containing protein [Bacteroidia bacterium]
MHKGKVKFFNAKNKFGFIVENGTGREFYVHVKDVTGTIAEGDEVEFELEEKKKGPAAVRVKKSA